MNTIEDSHHSAEMPCRVARRVLARTQLTKTGTVVDGSFSGHIEEGVFMNSSAYRYTDLISDAEGFCSDVEKELIDIGAEHMLPIRFENINLRIDPTSNILMLYCDFIISVTDKQLDLVRSHEWRIGEDTEPSVCPEEDTSPSIPAEL